MNPNQSISFSTAFAHCASTGSWWLSLGITVIILAALWIALEIEAKKANFDPSVVEKVLLVVTVFALGLAILMRPCEVAANTSIASAAKGMWLGY